MKSTLAANVRILSYSGEPFADRKEAGRLLAEALSHLANKKAVVLGIPRGGVVVAQGLALGLRADLDVVLSRKLGAPGHGELAVGAVAEDGRVFLNEEVVQDLGVGSDYIERERQRQLAEITRRSEQVRQVLPKVSLRKRVVVVTDDGVATGATMQAALWAARQEQPRRLIAAVPVASIDALRRVAGDADEVVCLRAPPYFAAVGQFYRVFDQVEDRDMLRLLGENKKRKVRNATG